MRRWVAVWKAALAVLLAAVFLRGSILAAHRDDIEDRHSLPVRSLHLTSIGNACTHFTDAPYLRVEYINVFRTRPYKHVASPLHKVVKIAAPNIYWSAMSIHIGSEYCGSSFCSAVRHDKYWNWAGVWCDLNAGPNIDAQRWAPPRIYPTNLESKGFLVDRVTDMQIVMAFGLDARISQPSPLR